MRWHDIEQNTDEWLQMRTGLLTGSNLAIVMANYGKAFGEPAKRLARNIAYERMTGQSMSEHYGDDFSSADMIRGHMQEPIARRLYEDETFCEVTNGGFYCNEWIGVSPDGLIDFDGQIEIKSVKPSAHHDNLIRKSYDPAYKWQIIGNLWASKRSWLDFVSFCSAAPVNHQLIVYRVEAEQLQTEFEQVDIRTGEFIALVASIMHLYDYESTKRVAIAA